jgi:hypothetical protein
MATDDRMIPVQAQRITSKHAGSVVVEKPGSRPQMHYCVA